MITIIAPLDSSPTTVTYMAAQQIYNSLVGSEEVRMLPILAALHWPFRFAEQLKKSDFIIYLGHGTRKGLVGQLPLALLRFLLKIGDDDLSDGRRIIAVACYSYWPLSQLKRRWATGAKSFMTVGYPNEEHNYAADFADTFVTLAVTGVKKDDPYAAVRKFQERCSHYIRLYEEKRWLGWEEYSYGMRINMKYYSVVRHWIPIRYGV